MTVKKCFSRLLKISALFLLLPPWLSNVIYAQEANNQKHIIKGKVTAFQSDEALPGVNILIAGTSKNTVTNENGDYQLAVSSLKDTLVFSLVGFKDRMVPTNGRTHIDIALKARKLKAKNMRRLKKKGPIYVSPHLGKHHKEPLILIDSVRSTAVDLSKLDPDSVAHFSILKDSAAVAKYGKEASEGVIIVTTKKGH